MKSNFGTAIEISLFGESHGKAIGAVINGLAPGIPLDLDLIQKQLNKRKPQGKISTQRQEADELVFLSGYFNGYTTGTPLCFIIENQCQHSKDYGALKNLLRPSHADYTAYAKYLGFQDYRGGGHFSGRITAPLVAAGAIFLQILATKNIHIGTHIAKLQNISDTAFAQTEEAILTQINGLNDKYFPTIADEAEMQMTACIEAAQKAGDSVGGILESAIIGVEAGIGEPFFQSIESVFSQLLFSIPGIKGVSFGSGFDFANMQGSAANDPFCYDNKQAKIKTVTNHNGGINGGISNGMPILVQCAVKPTPSIYQPQQTVNMATKEAETLQITGRHDPAIIHRARVVVDSMLAIGLVDLYTARYGYLWMTNK
ncbi:MAG: chorismate synthase [Peptococcaceae bacterium]|jgi:chorismate synthase|nr:chorismate synthase [Peptococcaceae bacterium]